MRIELRLTLGLALLLSQTIACAPHADAPHGEPPTDAASSSLLVAPTSAVSSVAVASGSDFTCAIVASGHVKCWGGNTSGQLGLGDTSPRAAVYDYLSFVDLGKGLTAKAITASGGTVCVILNTNQVKCWGENWTGQLGLGDDDDRGIAPGQMGAALPVVNLGTGRTAKAISTSGTHTCAVLDNGQLKCWGFNSTGQLGQGDTVNRGVTSGQMGDNLLPIFLGTGRTAKAVAAGGSHTCAILDNNKVRCWGRNEFAELGIGASGPQGIAPGQMAALTDVNLGTGRTAKVSANPIAALAAAGDRTCVVLDNGKLKCWGNNESILGVGTPDQKVGQPTCEISAPGPGCINGESNAEIALGTSRTAQSVAMSPVHICAVLDNGHLKCWGNNESGQLGQGNVSSRGETAGSMGDGLISVALGSGHTARSVATGYAFTCAVLDDYDLKCWGKGDSWQLGNEGSWNVGDEANEMGNSLAPVPLGSRAAKAVAAGANHTCALYTNGDVTCWGYNGFGRLGLSQVAVGDVWAPGNGYTVNVGGASKTIATGFSHSCAILNNDQIKCWGYNGQGQLGLGDMTQREVPAASTIALGTGLSALSVGGGGDHTCALLNNNQIKCWGNNDYGQLGLGDATRRLSPTSVVDLGAGLTVKKLAVGYRHNCAILSNDSVKCWGRNNYGQLGLGDANTRGDAAGEMGAALLPVSLGTGRTAKAISAGFFHTCAILDTNHVKCWGRNDDGQLGIGDLANRGALAGDMGQALPRVELGGGRTAKAVVAGAYSNCAILDDDTVKCWGDNGSGQLGLGDYADRGGSLGNMGDFLPPVDLDMNAGLFGTQLSVGRDHTCALLSSNQIDCWGDNSFYQAGGGASTPSPQYYPVDLGPEL